MLGTESYERRLCAEALEAQAGEIERLRIRAEEVIEAFEALGHTQGIASMLVARGRCEQVMLALKDALTPNERKKWKLQL